MLNEKSKTDDNDINLNSLIKMFFITFSVILFSAITYFIFHVAPSPLKPSEIGQIGDFYGGLLNPFLTFFTIIFLIWSIRLQSRELAATREELTFTREEIKQTAKSHKELVAQGNASFFIEQGIKSFESAELKIKKVFDYKIWITTSQLKGEPSRFIASFFEPGSNTHDAVKLSDWVQSVLVSFDDLPESKRTVYPDNYGAPIIKNLVVDIKQQLICLNALITYKGWIHAITCIHALTENIELLRRFEILSSNWDYIIHIIENSKFAIETYISQQTLTELKSSTVYVSVELNNYLEILLKAAKTNPYDDR